MDSCTCTFNGFPISSDFCRLLITYVNSLDPDQEQREKKVNFEKKKKQQTPTKAGPSKSGSHVHCLVTYSCNKYLILMGKKINF